MSIESHKSSCGNVHSYDPNKVKDLLSVTKCLFERLIKDVTQYARELEKFQEYYQRYDVVYDPNMYPIMLNRLTQTLTLFYVAFHNHLATKANVRGIGEQIIKPPWCDCNNNTIASTTIRYQNILKVCTECRQKARCDHVFSACRDYLKVQSTINVATYDNINISVPTTLTSDGSASECIITVGNLNYTLSNFPSSTLCSPSDIHNLYVHVDSQIKALAGLENALTINVEYIKKYLCKFSN